MSNLTGTPKFTSVVLTWSPPQEPNGVIVSYEVTYTVNGNNTVRVNTSDLSTTFTIPSLTPQTRISAITVTAYTRIGKGEPANLPYQTTLELRELSPLHACIILTVNYIYSLMSPAAVVMRLMVEPVSTSSVRVSWESIDNPIIINYTVYYYLLIGSCKEENNVTIPSSMNSIIIRNLTGSVITDYQFQVAATAEINGEVIMGERSEVRMSEVVPSLPTICTDPSKDNVAVL